MVLAVNPDNLLRERLDARALAANKYVVGGGDVSDQVSQWLFLPVFCCRRSGCDWLRLSSDAPTLLQPESWLRRRPRPAYGFRRSNNRFPVSRIRALQPGISAAISPTVLVVAIVIFIPFCEPPDLAAGIALHTQTRGAQEARTMTSVTAASFLQDFFFACLRLWSLSQSRCAAEMKA